MVRSDDLQGVDFDFRAFSHPASARTKIAMELAMSHHGKGSDFLALALIELSAVVGRIFSGRLEAVESSGALEFDALSDLSVSGSNETCS